jgi:hypothetical protein
VRTLYAALTGLRTLNRRPRHAQNACGLDLRFTRGKHSLSFGRREPVRSDWLGGTQNRPVAAPFSGVRKENPFSAPTPSEPSATEHKTGAQALACPRRRRPPGSGGHLEGAGTLL